MPTSSAPEPSDRGDARRERILSDRERRILAAIEHDLTSADPGLARELGRRQRSAALRWWPLSVRAGGLLLVTQAVLVLTGALVPPTWWPVTGLLATVLVVAWLLFAAAENSTGHTTENAGSTDATAEDANRRNANEKDQPGRPAS